MNKQAEDLAKDVKDFVASGKKVMIDLEEFLNRYVDGPPSKNGDVDGNFYIKKLSKQNDGNLREVE